MPGRRSAAHPAKDGVLLVQPLALAKGDKELAAIGVGLVLVGTRDEPPAGRTYKRAEGLSAPWSSLLISGWSCLL